MTASSRVHIIIKSLCELFNRDLVMLCKPDYSFDLERANR